MLSVGASVGFFLGDVEPHKIFLDIQKLKPTSLFMIPGLAVRLHKRISITVSSQSFSRFRFYLGYHA